MAESSASAACLAFVARKHVPQSAERKGLSYGVFFVACVVLSPVVALVLLEIAPDNRPRVGDLVATVSRVDLEDGTVVERKFRAEVLAMKVIDQVAVVQVNGPDRPVWVARDGVRKF